MAVLLRRVAALLRWSLRTLQPDLGIQATQEALGGVEDRAHIGLLGRLVPSPDGHGGDVGVQTDRVLKNLSAILKTAGSGLEKVVRSTVFLKNMGDFAAMNEVYGRYFNTAPPARSTVEVARLPKDVLVEIDVVALV